MSRSFFFRFAVLMAAFGLAFGSFSAQSQDTSKRGRKYKLPPPTSRIEITILRDVNGKPIENAAVIFHPMEGEKDMGNMEMKTNEDGKAVIDVLPIGDTVRLQIIAKGFQTYGQDFKVDKAQMAFDVRMKRPGQQYSIYKPGEGRSDGGKNPDAGKGGGAPPEKPAVPGETEPKDKPKPDSQPQTN